MNIIPCGNKIIAKFIENHTTKGGLYIPASAVNEVNGNAHAEIVALPDPITNPHIKSMAIGDIVICKKFQADTFKDKEGNECAALDVEPADGSRAGQVLAIIKK